MGDCSAAAGFRVPDPEPTKLDALEQRIGYRFRSRGLLEQALTHSSSAHERGDPELGNERLEFLGDAVLGLLIAEALMEQRPERPEGELSRARASLVNGPALAALARELGLDACVSLGRGERLSGGRRKTSILANLFEALLGAAYLDGGLDPVRALVRREFAAALAGIDRRRGDPKTRLQELLQSQGRALPIYELLGTTGPDHERRFEVGVRLGADLVARASGSSKRAAEQEAARRALEGLE
jgi:ribonuclease III